MIHIGVLSVHFVSFEPGVININLKNILLPCSKLTHIYGLIDINPPALANWLKKIMCKKELAVKFVGIFVVSFVGNDGIKRLNTSRWIFSKNQLQKRSVLNMVIKAGSWRMLTHQDKMFILKAISDRSKRKKQEGMENIWQVKGDW